VRLAGALLVAAVLPACTGDNLFTGLGASVGLLGPEVDITVPAANLALAVGDSVQVTANVSSPDGITQVKWTGTFTTGAGAWQDVVVTLPNPQDTTVSRYLRQLGVQTGSARIIVEATEVGGDVGADTVLVSIN
jgi:hypothetical protein